MPTPENLFGSILVGSIGLAAIVYGKNTGRLRPRIIGLVMMVYPFFFSSTLVLYAIGVALTAALFVFRD